MESEVSKPDQPYSPIKEDFSEGEYSRLSDFCDEANFVLAESDPVQEVPTNDNSGLSRIAPGEKAGMGGFDKAAVTKVIYEASKDSRYFKNEMRKDERTTARIAALLDRKKSLGGDPLTPCEHRAMTSKVDKMINGRDLSRTWIHIDMDSFYASCELLDRPDLVDKPVGIGGMGMLSTSNYVARKYGVRAAMPGFIGKKLCPDLIIIPPSYEKYSEASGKVRAVLEEFDRDYAMLSLDEGFCDVSDYLAAHKDMTPESVASAIREKINAATRLTASAGIAPNRFLAKICSDVNKPNGQFYLKPDVDTILSFIRPLQIRKVPGIGKVSERVLKEVLGVNTCADLWDMRAFVYTLLGDVAFESYMCSALGLGQTRKVSREERAGQKSISTERTFRDCSDYAVLASKCEDLVTRLVEDMKSHEALGKTLTVKLKSASFEVISRAVTFPRPTADRQMILEHSLKILSAEMPKTLRLMGVRMSALSFPNNEKGTLMDFLSKKGEGAKESSSIADTGIENDESGENRDRPHSLNAIVEAALPVAPARCRDDVPQPMEHPRCPMCNKELLATSNILINQHIDSCLAPPSSSTGASSSAYEGRALKKRKGAGSLKNVKVKADTKQLRSIDQWCVSRNIKQVFKAEGAGPSNSMPALSESGRDVEARTTVRFGEVERRLMGPT